MSNVTEEEEIRLTAPDGLKELMSDISREVLRQQPKKIFEFIANYLSALLITREHGIVSVKILADLCDCKPTLSMHLMELGLEVPVAQEMAEIIKREIEDFEPITGKERVREVSIMKKILSKFPLDEETCAKVCQIIRNAHNDYWYRKKTLEQSIKTTPDEPWEIAAEHTLELYKKTRPTMAELERATIKIQSAYRAYHVRKELLNHLKQKPTIGVHVQTGPPAIIPESREIDLGAFISLKVAVTDDIESKMAKAKPTPSLKFTQLDNEKSIIISNDKRSASKGIEEPEYMIARTETDSAAFCRSNQPRISFCEAPPVVIEGLDSGDGASEDFVDKLIIQENDNMTEVLEAAMDSGGRYSSTATSLIESMVLTDVEDVEG